MVLGMPSVKRLQKPPAKVTCPLKGDCQMAKKEINFKPIGVERCAPCFYCSNNLSYAFGNNRIMSNGGEN
jgi:hypothetical protein